MISESVLLISIQTAYQIHGNVASQNASPVVLILCCARDERKTNPSLVTGSTMDFRCSHTPWNKKHHHHLQQQQQHDEKPPHHRMAMAMMMPTATTADGNRIIAWKCF